MPLSTMHIANPPLTRALTWNWRRFSVYMRVFLQRVAHLGTQTPTECYSAWVLGTCANCKKSKHLDIFLALLYKEELNFFRVLGNKMFSLLGTSWPPQEAIITSTWPPFFQFNKRLLRQKTGGACLYMPNDGHWLASFEVIPPPQKKVSSSAAKRI